MDCTWNTWSSWGSCSRTCGGGNMTRSRTQNGRSYGGQECSGSSTASTSCNPKNCPGKGAIKCFREKNCTILLSVNCTWNAWSSWGSCSRTCGGGNMTRSRTKNGPFFGGQECSGSSNSSTSCNTDGCPGEGEMNRYSLL